MIPRFLLTALLSTTVATMDGGATGPAVQAVTDPAQVFLAQNRTAKGVFETPSGLQYQVIRPGAGDARPTDDDIALVLYEGRLVDGTTFDRSEQPAAMAVSGVVPGFAEALKLMPKGAKYRFWIKPSLGYGEEVNGPIPAHSVLVFDVELLDFLSQDFIRQVQQGGTEAQQSGK